MHNRVSKYNLKRFIENAVVPDLISLGFYNDYLKYFRKTQDITQVFEIILNEACDEIEVKYGLHSDEIVMNSFEDFIGFLTPGISSCFWGSALGSYKLDEKDFDTSVIEPFMIKFKNEVLPIFKNVLSLKDTIDLCNEYPERFLSSSLFKPVYYLTIGDISKGTILFKSLVSNIREWEQKLIHNQGNLEGDIKDEERIARKIEWYESNIAGIAQRFKIDI